MTERTSGSYRTVDIETVAEAAEAMAETLWESGASGVETLAEGETTTRLRGYFPGDVAPAEVAAALDRAARAFGLGTDGVRTLATAESPNEDWLKKWKESYACFPVGARWLVVPSWRRAEAEANPEWRSRLRLEIDPGMAFGTGTHETTRVCLELLEDAAADEVRSVVDVGTGTGILAMAAARLFPAARIDACDTDAEAIAVARENAVNNGLAERIAFWCGSVGDRAREYDLVFANLTADAIVPLASALADATRAGGTLILSGVLDVQAAAVAAAIAAVGGDVREVRSAGEWRGLAVRRRSV
jgi:ribosomal protein L11 methyltransferase